MKTLNHNTKLAALVAVATLGVTLLTTGAQAAEAMGPEARTVRYADVNLNTAAGAKVLYQRIQRAAEAVCGQADARQIERAEAAKACVDQAILTSVRAVNNAQLVRTARDHGYEVYTPVTLAQVR